MPTFEITFIYPGTSLDRRQSLPHKFDADSTEDAKVRATELIEVESTHHRTVDIAVLTTSTDQIMEITRWHRNGGWIG